MGGFAFADNDGISYGIEPERQEISLLDLSELMHAEGNIISIRNYVITTSEKDIMIGVDDYVYVSYIISPKDKVVKKRLVLHNCIFKLKEDEHLVFKGWDIKDLQIVGCEFHGEVKFEDTLDHDEVNFFIENCIFNDQVIICNTKSQNTGLKLRGNLFKSNVYIDGKYKDIEIDDCIFNSDSLLFQKKQERKTFYQLELSGQNVEKLTMTKNIFDNNNLSDLYSVNLASSKIKELKMISNRMQILNLSGAEVTKSFLVDSLFVDDYIGILNFDFPQSNTNISWYNLGGEKFSIFEIKEKKHVPYQAKTNKELADNLKFNDLMSAYNKFNKLYHDRGDIVSANASYVEIKDIETRKQAYIQKINPTLSNKINYGLNLFLKVFSDYATNPGKSMKQSIYLILFFAFLYVFTFSGWDKVSLNFFFNELDVFNQIVNSEKGVTIHEILEKRREKLKLMDKNQLETNDSSQQNNGLRKKPSRSDKFFVEPIYFIGKFRYRIIPGLIELFGISKITWDKQKPFKNIIPGVVLIIISLLFVVYVAIVRIFVSIMLSLNSFIVIGFGNLPEEDKSIAMYLTIIEGIIGWFLLTIFTVTLLSQVLQSA